MTSGTQWSMRGEYFENCNCDVICPCPTTGLQARPDKGNCDVIFGFNLGQGNYGDVSLNDLSFVLVISTPGVMSEGNATAAVYIDERANPQQRDALSAIVSGQAGGAPARLRQAISITNFLGTKFVPISFRKEGHQRGASIPDILDWNVEGLPGANPEDVQWVDNARNPTNTRVAIARGTRNTYRDYDLNWDNTGQNGFFSEFEWSGP